MRLLGIEPATPGCKAHEKVCGAAFSWRLNRIVRKKRKNREKTIASSARRIKGERLSNMFISSCGWVTGARRLELGEAIFLVLVGRLEDLEGAHECLVNGHHGARVVKLPAIVGRRKQRHQLPLREKLIPILNHLVRSEIVRGVNAANFNTRGLPSIILWSERSNFLQGGRF